MIDASGFEQKFKNLSSTYFKSLNLQDTDPDQFTAIRSGLSSVRDVFDNNIIRHNVISLVEGSPHKLCDQGWNYDHRNVFKTITSEVVLLMRRLFSFNHPSLPE